MKRRVPSWAFKIKHLTPHVLIISQKVSNCALSLSKKKKKSSVKHDELCNLDQLHSDSSGVFCLLLFMSKALILALIIPHTQTLVDGCECIMNGSSFIGDRLMMLPDPAPR